MFHHSLNLNCWSSHNSWSCMGENVLEIRVLYIEFITKISTFPIICYWWSNSIWAKQWIDFLTWIQNQNCSKADIVFCGFFSFFPVTVFHLTPSFWVHSLQNCLIAALCCDRPPSNSQIRFLPVVQTIPSWQRVALWRLREPWQPSHEEAEVGKGKHLWG